jgi:molybdopterin synthase catalytic subunit
MTQTRIVVSPARFSVGEEYPWLAERDEDGAVVTFTGKVRNHNLGDSVKALTLEHYPGMTEKSLAEIVELARERWPLGRVTVIHRIGEMWPGKRIVCRRHQRPPRQRLRRRRVYYGLPENPRAVLEARGDAGRRTLGRRPRQRSSGGRALVV